MFRPCLARACAVVTSVALMLAACGSTEEDDDEATVTPTAVDAPSTTASPSSTELETTTTSEAVRVIDVVFTGGRVTGGVQTVTVGLGEKVRLRVTSDVAEEVHVHTYDNAAPVAPGQPAEIELTATIPGRHEVELEKKRRTLLVLEVQ